MILAALLLFAAAPVDCCGWSAPLRPRRMKGVLVNDFKAPYFYENIVVGEIAPRTPFAWL
ncbi:hypothetical protein [Sphingomonas sp. Mn802worker]|uniref:hypothetical protein n=1 Tax=Sphingomonas sp. Mn802worker TaxID=629773 RepID=UPI00036957D0|nr:hypothetical protein [Sphingomonas sp. Mn802worker]